MILGGKESPLPDNKLEWLIKTLKYINFNNKNLCVMMNLKIESLSGCGEWRNRVKNKPGGLSFTQLFVMEHHR